MGRHGNSTEARRAGARRALSAALAGLFLICGLTPAWAQSGSQKTYEFKPLELPKLPVAPLVQSQKQTADRTESAGGPPRTAIGSLQLHSGATAYAYLSGIPGPATQVDHAGWFELLGLSEEIASPAASPSQRGAMAVSMRPLTLVKPIDAASVHIREHAASGRPVASASVALATKQGKDVYRLTLEDVLVTGVRARFDENGVREEVDLVYGRIRWSFNVYDQTGRMTGTISRCWNVAANQPC